MRTLGERIRWLLGRPDLYGETKENQLALARRAGLATRHISTFLSRSKADPTVALDTPTLAKIAKATGVRLEWLATGAGAPFDGGMTAEERGYKAAELLGYDRQDIDAVRSREAADGYAGRTARDVLRAIHQVEARRLDPLRGEVETPERRPPPPRGRRQRATG